MQFKKGSETQRQINEVSKWTAAELNYHPDSQSTSSISKTQRQINKVSKWTAAELNYHPDRVPLVAQKHKGK